MQTKKSCLKIVLTGLVLALLTAGTLLVLYGWQQGHFNSPESLKEYIGSFGLLAPLMLILIQAIQVIVPVLPGFFGSIVGAGMFSVSGNFWCNYLGISAGSIAAFWLARRFGTGLVRQLLPLKKYQRWTNWLNRSQSYTVVLALAILLPLAPDDFLCYFSGLTGMSAKKFVWIILLAKPWCILVYSFAFAYLL